MNEGPPQSNKKPDEPAKKPAVPPIKKKAPEPPGNLRRREEWFRKRSGS
jgi:hypothetical protein